MREIKFRGKDIVTSEWRYGDLRHRIACCPSIIHDYNNNGKIDYAETPVHRDSVGQFTGLFDKNGKEIYEGDIVKWILTMPSVGVNGGYEEYETEEIDVIKWDSGALYLGEYCAAVFADESEDYAEVLGNIHDNPELLNE